MRASIKQLLCSAEEISPAFVMVCLMSKRMGQERCADSELLGNHVGGV